MTSAGWEFQATFSLAAAGQPVVVDVTWRQTAPGGPMRTSETDVFLLSHS